MFELSWRRLLPVVLWSLPLAGGATAPDPLDASTPVARILHESAFRHYRSHADVGVGARDWKATNDTVGRIGGWRAYAREASAPASAPAPATVGTTAPAMPAGHDHGGHSERKKP